MDQDTGRRLTVYLKAERGGGCRISLHFDATPVSDWTAFATRARTLAEGWEIILHVAKLHEVPGENIILIHEPARHESARTRRLAKSRRRPRLLPNPAAARNQPASSLVFYLSPGRPDGFVLDVERFGPRRELIRQATLSDRAELPTLIDTLCAEHGAPTHQLLDLTEDCFRSVVAPASPEEKLPAVPQAQCDSVTTTEPVAHARSVEIRFASRTVTRPSRAGYRAKAVRLGSRLAGVAVLGMFAATTYCCVPGLANLSFLPWATTSPQKQDELPRQAGLGFGRGPLVRTLTLLDYGIQPDTDGRGQPRWRAQGPLGVAEIIGPDENLTAFTLLLHETREADAEEEVREQIGALFDIAFPDWQDGEVWLSRAIKSGRGVIIRDGKEAHVDRIKGVGLMLSVGLPQVQMAAK